jgi:hypothetical protein
LESLFDKEEEREDAPYAPPLSPEASHTAQVEESEQTPLPRRTPGAGPMPGPPTRGSTTGPSDGYMIKGHFASRQYHTPDSPQYERVVAEVWFRTAADAEQAGFEAWNARTQD